MAGSILRRGLEYSDGSRQRFERNPGGRGAKGTLQIGVTPQSPKLLSPVLRTCKDRYPNLKIQVNENLRRSLLENLINGDLEVVISSYSGSHKRICRANLQSL